MSIDITLHKGLDLNLEGPIDTAHAQPHPLPAPRSCALVPDDFHGLVPKMDVRPGDRVAVGSPLFHDKNHPQVVAVSPMAGRVADVVRGERRKVLRVVVEEDPDAEPLPAVRHDVKALGALEGLCASGLWVALRQRPYDIVPDPAVRPRDIFVTAVDSAPLALDLAPRVASSVEDLQRGVALLRELTDGRVFIGCRPGALPDIPGAEMIHVSGPHPAGNAGVQAANVAPVNKGETVWTLDAVTLAKIGVLARTGSYDPTAVVAVTGSEVATPQVVETIVGAPMADILDDDLRRPDHHIRIISGNVLTGVRSGVNPDDYLRFPYLQVTVIPDGDDVDQFMGWATMSPAHYSASRSFPGHFLKGRRFNPDARLLGGRRAMIMSGEYDKVLPMDILPEYLLKAIISRDIDRMEQLGIYEIAPEDMALCEYVDTSKIEVQRLVREGLDYLRKELE